MSVDFIYQKLNCLTDEKCDKITELFEQLKQYHRPGGTTNGVDTTHKKSTDMCLNVKGCKPFENEKFRLSMEDLLINLCEGLKEYKEKYTINGVGIDSVAKWALCDKIGRAHV